MLIVAIVFSVLFVYIYRKGFAVDTVLAGIRYGLLMSLMHPFVASFSQYAIYPLPFSLIWQLFASGVIQITLVWCGCFIGI